ncbi:ABC transporter substrate-binding protein [Oryzobacter telluris]|uniref:ABC transporter substrate-binding protein n=1 Tax=Oryzobacter telluris TaxID=3149179 RepID=UPI00370DB5E3
MRRWMVVLAGSLALAACTTPGASSPAPSSSSTGAVSTDVSGLPATTLSVWTSESGSRLDLLKARGEAFTAAHPNIKVAWTVRDFGAYPAQIKLALTSDDGPDVCIGNLGWSLDGPLIKAGLLRPMDDYAAAYKWTDRYPAVGLRQLKFTADGKKYGEGSIYGTPYAADVIGWFYNKDLLAKTGKQLPTTMAELDDVLAASKAAGQQPIVFGEKDGWPGWHLAYNLIDQYASAKEVSGIVYDDAGASYENPAIARALQTMVEWKKKGYIRADVNSIAQADVSAGFPKGEGLFFPAGSWEAANMGPNFGFFLTPPVEKGTPPRATGSFGYSFHVSSRSTKVPASAAFLDFMANEDTAKAFFAGGDIAPIAVKDPQLKSGDVFKDIYTSWTDVLESDGLLPYLEFATPTAGEVLYPQLQEVLEGRTQVADALKAMETDRQTFTASNK